MLTEAQREFRKTGVGASESAALFGVHPYLSAMELYARKIGVAPESEGSERLWWGSVAEPLILERYGFVKDCRVNVDPGLCHMLRLGMMPSPVICNLDGWAGKPVEAKTVSSRAWWQQWDNGKKVPLYVQCQVQHQMLVTGTEQADIAALVDWGLHIIPVKRDDAFCKKLLNRIESFWRENVLAKVPPSWDGSESCYKALGWLNPADEAEGLELLPELADDAFEYVALGEQEKVARDRRREIKNKITAAMGSAKVADLGDGRIVVRQKNGALKVKDA